MQVFFIWSIRDLSGVSGRNGGESDSKMDDCFNEETRKLVDQCSMDTSNSSQRITVSKDPSSLSSKSSGTQYWSHHTIVLKASPARPKRTCGSLVGSARLMKNLEGSLGAHFMIGL